jgi:DNA-binding HxlR family transcriptional regulator
MQRRSFADMECPMARSLEQVGDGWSLLILRDALLGARRFQEFQQGLCMAPNTLARRLGLLTEQGLLSRQRYAERPPRERYELTQKGRELAPVLLALSTWGNRWLAPEGAPLECVDPRTGALVEPIVVDKHTLRPLSAGSVALRAGAGASRKLRRSLPGQVLFGTRGGAGSGEP